MLREHEHLSIFSELPLIIQQALLKELAGTRETTWLPPEVLNPNIPEDAMRLDEISAETSSDRIRTPFDSALKEFCSLQNYYKHHLEMLGLEQASSVAEIKTAYTELFKSQVMADAQAKNSSLDEQSVGRIAEESIIFGDVARLTHELMALQTGSDFSEHVRFIWDPNDKLLSAYISEEMDSLLKKTRMLGLIPFEVIDKLQSMKIVVLGASVAASTVDLLVAMGARDIEFIDDGELDPSNGQKMPAGPTADFNSNGTSKVHALAQSIYQRNPFGNFVPHRGRVVMDEAEKRPTTDDKTLDEMMTPDTGLVIEVIDDPQTKMKIRMHMQEKYPETPISFIADVGNDAFAGLENSGDGKYFNQELTGQQEEYLKKIAKEGYSSRLDALTAIFLMVKDQLPSDHKLQVMLGRYGGIIPFLAQTGIAARESSYIAVSEVLQYLQNKDITGNNLTKQTSPDTLVPKLSSSATQTLDEIFNLAITQK
jgi:hypothetical protein